MEKRVSRAPEKFCLIGGALNEKLIYIMTVGERDETLSYFFAFLPVSSTFFDLFRLKPRLLSINPGTVKGKTVEIRQVFGSYLLLVQA